jgi:glycosyltransferase involved in cell wall biosynthesis
MAAGLDVVLRAARVLKEKGRDDIKFLLAGDGAERCRLETEARESGLETVLFIGLVPKEEVPTILASSNVCLVHLRKKRLFQSVLPSKIFEAAAMEKAIVLGVEGDAANLVSEMEAGICVEPENELQLAEALVKLSASPEDARKKGRAGREHVVSTYEYNKLADDYLGVIQEMIGDVGKE